jgi:hypothetical protein
VLGQDRPALIRVGAVEADDDGRPDVDPSQRLHDAVGNLLALRDATEDVDEDGLHAGVVVDDLERVRHHVGVGAAADVEEVRRLTPDLAHDVDRAHRQPGAVGDDPDVPVESDVLQSLGVRGRLALVALLRRFVLGPVVAEGGVVVERHLGVERVHSPAGRQDQGIDLDEVGVAIDIGAVQLRQDVDRAVGGARVEVGALDPLARHLLAQAVDGIDLDPCNCLRLLLRDLLDVDAAAGGQQAEVQLGRAIQRERRVVLLCDVAGALYPERLDNMTLDVHAQDVHGVRADLVGVGRELDAACLAPPTHVDLGLHHDRVADLVGGLDRLRHGEHGAAR